MTIWVILDGYVVRRTTRMAIGVAKDGLAGVGEPLDWIPRSCCRDGDSIEEGEKDLEVMEYMAEQKGLDF